jgi:hypothetical protein
MPTGNWYGAAMSQIQISGGGLPSRFQIGERAYFQPRLNCISRSGKTDPNEATECEILACKFGLGKVYYDIDLLYPANNGTVTTIMLENIPSDLLAESV